MRAFRLIRSRPFSKKNLAHLVGSFQPRLEILESRELLTAAPLLHVSADGRHLLDSANQPVYLVGDTAWSLAVSLSESDAISYLQQRGAQGFNAVLVDSVALRSIISGS